MRDAMLPESVDDVDAILVYADDLMSRGHPHGNLIALQHAKKNRQANTWLQKHAKEILGDLADNERIDVKWTSGFIHSASLTEWDDEGLPFEVQYDQLRACPAAQLIRELSLSQAPMDQSGCTSDQGYCYEGLLARMAKHPLPTLRHLDVGGDVNKPEYNCALGLDRVLAKHPSLQEISISGGVYDFGSPKLPNLHKLRILADHDGTTIRKLARADLPMLDELDLHGGGRDDDEPTAADYVKLFTGERMPKLRRLQFSTTGEVFLDACRALLASPLVRQLDELVLDFIDNAIADLVLQDPTPLRHIKKLALTTLDRRDMSPARRTRLKKALPKLR